MAYGPPPSPGHGQQPGYGSQSAWQQPWQQPPPGAAPAPGHHGPASGDDTTWALMAYVGQFLLGAIAPAVVFFGKGRSAFVRRHAAQGLNMGLAAIAVWFAGGLISLMISAFVWVPLGFTAAVMFYLVYAGRAANRGEFRRVPAVVAWPLLKVR